MSKAAGSFGCSYKTNNRVIEFFSVEFSRTAATESLASDNAHYKSLLTEFNRSDEEYSRRVEWAMAHALSLTAEAKTGQGIKEKNEDSVQRCAVPPQPRVIDRAVPNLDRGSFDVMGMM